MAKTHYPVVYILLALALIDTLPSSAGRCRNESKTFLGERQLTEKDKQDLLAIHNQLRDIIAAGDAYGRRQPPAQNMLELTWDEYAANLASSWARTCQFEHNQPTDERDKPLGQNLAIKMSSELSNVNKTFENWMISMVKGWFNEVKLHTFGSGFSLDTGHYTQLVWATTAKLGCGYSYYKEIDLLGNTWHVGYLVCNYNPAGNWVGEDPYKTGKVNCTAYNLDSSTNYPNLCVEKQGNH